MPVNTAIAADHDDPCVPTPTLTPKTIGDWKQYDPTVLKEMRVQHDQRYKTLPIEAIKIIRKYRT